MVIASPGFTAAGLMSRTNSLMLKIPAEPVSLPRSSSSGLPRMARLPDIATV